MQDPVGTGELLWSPSAEWVAGAQLTGYMSWLAAERGLRFAGYRELWDWSVSDLAGFWASIWDYFDVLASAPADTTLADARMPGRCGFPAPA